MALLPRPALTLRIEDGLLDLLLRMPVPRHARLQHMIMGQTEWLSIDNRVVLELPLFSHFMPEIIMQVDGIPLMPEKKSGRTA
ncbi:hypothetical protein [Azospirillum sp. B2RO_4]|uniref:hypothetical protein n=1 Tax=Azospirillum sp. B2RO_4 TaxID=3027796 RepID=UPI003DA96427